MKFSVFISFFLISISSYGQDVKNHLKIAPGIGSLEIPAEVGMSCNSITVQTWGAGAGGGGPAKLLLGTLNLANVAGGGGGGAFKGGTLDNIGANSDNVKISYTVGAGGKGGFSGSENGKDGGNTVFSTFSANGGKGGTAGILLGPLLNPSASYGIGGKGGNGGDFSAGNGYNAGLLEQGIGLVSGSGGGGAGSGGNGFGSAAEILSQNGGAGGVANNNDGGVGGKGGDGLLVLNLENGNGKVGSSPGGGGGGSVVLLNLVNLLGNPKGGDGGNGQIKVTYTCPTYSLSSITADATCPPTAMIKLKGNLPVGRYYVTYERTFQGVTTTVPEVEMKVSTAGECKITVANLPTVGLTSIKIKKITSVDCSTDNIDKYIILGKPEIPIGGTPIQPTCAIPSGSVVLSGLSTLSTWTINAIPNTIGLTGLTGTGSATTISGLDPSTTYKFIELVI